MDSYNQNLQRSFEKIQIQQLNKLDEKSNIIQTMVESIKKDLIFLAHTPPPRGILRAKNNNGIDPIDGSKLDEWKKRFTTILSEYANSKNNIYHLTFIDSKGKPILGISKNPNSPISEEIKNLSKSFEENVINNTQDFFLGDLEIAKVDETYINPPISYINISIPIMINESEETPSGYLVIGVLGDHIFSSLINSNENYFIIDENEQFVFHKNPDSTWSKFLKKELKEDNIFNQIQFKTNENFYSIEDQVYFLKQEPSNSFMQNNKWQIMSKLSLELIHRDSDIYLERFIKTSIIAIIISTSFMFFFLEWLVRSKISSPIWRNLSGLENSFKEVLNTSNKIEAAGKELAQSSGGQLKVVEKNSANILQMGSILSKTDEFAQSTNLMAQKGIEHKNSAEKGLKNTISAMEEITAATEQLITMSEIINNIKKKTDIINRIVSETRLLSFNASIEAARAGENGKGFSVVAFEIGKLADVSGAAADEITSLLDESYQKVDEVIVINQERVEQGKEKINELKGSFDSMADLLKEITNSIGKISRSSGEHRRGVDQMGHAMDQINTIANNNDVLSNEMVEKSYLLKKESQIIQNFINDLKKVVQNK